MDSKHAPGKSTKPPSTPKEADVDHVPVSPNSQTLRISLVPSPGARTSLPSPRRRRAVEVGVACVVFWPCCREGESEKPCFACVACSLCFRPNPLSRPFPALFLLRAWGLRYHSESRHQLHVGRLLKDTEERTGHGRAIDSCQLLTFFYLTYCFLSTRTTFMPSSGCRPCLYQARLVVSSL
ncbi:hypothetical protein LZ30DRAFT_185297 [Colletotrichum cereale]|nr:hypothetical protein LZ30DRAFT_185297 [Colletotrichum cereale]